jgi:hypothetical protein
LARSSEHEDRDLKLVIAEVPVRVFGHVERPPAHDDRADLGDQPVHVIGVAEDVRVREALDAAVAISDEATETAMPACYSCHVSLAGSIPDGSGLKLRA